MEGSLTKGFAAGEALDSSRLMHQAFYVSYVFFLCFLQAILARIFRTPLGGEVFNQRTASLRGCLRGN